MPSILTALFMLPVTLPLTPRPIPSYSLLVLFAFLFHYAKEKRWRCLFCTFHWSEAATPRLTPLMENYNFFLLIFWHAYFSFFIFFPQLRVRVFCCAALLAGCQAMGMRLRIRIRMRIRRSMWISVGSISVI